MLSPHPVVFGVGLRLEMSSVELQLNLAPLVNVLSWEVTATNEATTARKENRTVWFALSPSIVLDWQMTHQASLFIAISLDIYLRKTAFEVQREGVEASEPLLDFWRASPLFQIGAQFGFSG